jgi:hypothetical protein
MVQIPQWYGVYKDDTLSTAINFRGPDYNQYTLAITRGDDVQLCHGRRTDLPGLTDPFDGTPTFVDLSMAFPGLSGVGHLVCTQISPEQLPVPVQFTSDVTSFIESDRVLRALLLRTDTTDLTRQFRGTTMTMLDLYL